MIIIADSSIITAGLVITVGRAGCYQGTIIINKGNPIIIARLLRTRNIVYRQRPAIIINMSIIIIRRPLIIKNRPLIIIRGSLIINNRSLIVTDKLSIINIKSSLITDMTLVIIITI